MVDCNTNNLNETRNRCRKTDVSMNRYTLAGYTPQTNLNRLNLGVSHNLTKDLALRASYDIRKDDDFTQQGVNVGVVLDF